MTNIHATVTQIVAYKKETTPGGGGTPDTRLAATKMAYWSPVGQNTPVTPSGNLVPTTMIHGKESAMAPISGQQTYADLDVLFGSALCSASGGVCAPKASGGDAFDTFAIRAGDALASYAYNFCYVDSLELTGDPQKAEVGGQFLGGIEVPGGSLGTLSELAAIPVQPADTGLWTASSFGGSYSRVSNGFAYALRINNRRNQVYTLDDSIPSFTALTEKLLEGSATLELDVVADVSGSDYGVGPFTLQNWRKGQTVFVQIKAAPAGHSLILTCCAVIDRLNKKDFQGTLALTASMHLADDGSGNWISAAAS